MAGIREEPVLGFPGKLGTEESDSVGPNPGSAVVHSATLLSVPVTGEQPAQAGSSPCGPGPAARLLAASVSSSFKRGL